MTCYQSKSLPSGFSTAGKQSYATEADCLNACKEGACCDGTTCSVKPQCQCQGTGQVFNGVGTTCATNPCCTCETLVMVQVKLASVVGGSVVTRYGCNGVIQENSTRVVWSCGSSGCTMTVTSYYSTKFDGNCNVNYPYAVGLSKGFSPVSSAVASSGPCVGVSSVGWPVATTFRRSDFSVSSDIPPYYASVPDGCWGFGPPSTDAVFPQFVYIGPANPLP